MIGFLSSMMGGQSSKTKTNDPSVASAFSTPRPVRTDMGSIYSADLSSYKRACELDPELKAFDTTLHERTNRVINSLAAGAESRALSLDSVVDVTGCLLEMNEEVVKLLIESKEDVWKNKDFSSLVDIYFESTIKTLDFCNTVENCVKRTRISQLIIHFAVKQFERESEMEPQERVGKKKYAKTLEELRKFKAAGDPFRDDFFVQFESVYEQQIALLEELHKQKIKLDKKLKTVKSWRKVSNMVFVTAFVSVLILSVVAAAVAAPPVVTAVAAALAVPVGSVGKWCSHLWKKYETAVKSQKDVVLSIKFGAKVTKKHLDNIRVLVENLGIEIETLQMKADFALREDEDLAVKLAIDEISRRLDDFMEKIERVGLHAAKCNKDITLARTIVLRHILSFPSNSSSGETLMEILPM